MEERNQMSNSDWYRPNGDALPEEQVTDLFEEAGLYRVKSREELYAQNKPKKVRWWLILTISAVALALMCVGVHIYIDKKYENQNNEAKDFFDAYSEYYSQMEEDDVTGENEIPRADTNPDLELQLQDTLGDTKLSLQELYDTCAPSVVGISTYADGSPYGWGTGVIMTADGYIITNTHVLDDADRVEVVLYSGEVVEAKLVGADAISDIGLLKIDAKGLTPAKFVDSALVRVGDEAIAIGNPLGEDFSGTMSTGIISGVSRNVSHNNRTMTLLQTDAALNSGNSGGALFNIYGQVVGITNMKMMGSFTSAIEGVGFAIPTVTVKGMVDAILDDGAVVGRPGLGVTVYDLSELGDVSGMEEFAALGTDYPDGLMIYTVVEGSDCAKKGLQRFDIITEVDGVAAESVEALGEVINAKRVGDSVTVKVWRSGEYMELDVALIDQNDF